MHMLVRMGASVELLPIILLPIILASTPSRPLLVKRRVLLSPQYSLDGS